MDRPLDVWDLGGVLVDVDFERFVRAVLATDPGADAAFLRSVPALPLKADLDRGRVAPAAFADAVLAGSGARIGRDGFLAAWADIFTPRPEAVAWLEASRATHELWLLSDTDPVHIARVDRDWPTGDLWSRRLLSFEQGRIKIDPGAFEPLAEQVRRGRAVRFFDDREDNVEAARAAGVPALVFTDWAGFRKGTAARR
jgi:FMN phosphatase YigB (HAD superfamily)